jgi:hypothetical protein
MARHRRRSASSWTRWAWDWEGGKRTLSLAGWLVASWLLVGVLSLGLTISDRMWHADTTWVNPERVTTTEKEPR